MRSIAVQCYLDVATFPRAFYLLWSRVHDIITAILRTYYSPTLPLHDASGLVWSGCCVLTAATISFSQPAFMDEIPGRVPSPLPPPPPFKR